MNQGAFSEAGAIFQQIVERYGDTEFGGSAKEQLANLRLLSPEYRSEQWLEARLQPLF